MKTKQEQQWCAIYMQSPVAKMNETVVILPWLSKHSMHVYAKTENSNDTKTSRNKIILINGEVYTRVYWLT